jgi:site-specific recombinase XerD
MFPLSRSIPHLTFSDSLPTFDGMKRTRKYRKPEVVKLGNIVVKVYRRDKTHKVKDDAGKVIKRVTYTAFEVDDRTTGKRRLRSFSDHKEAIAEANRIARQLSSGAVEAAQMTNSQAASFGRATELLRPTGASLELAASVYAKCYEILGGDKMVQAAEFFDRHDAGKITSKTVGEVVTELLQVKGARTKKGRPASARYLKDLKNRLDRFANDYAVDIGSVTTGDVQKWIDNLNIDGKPIAPQTARNFRTVLYTLFQFAEARGYIFKDGNPVKQTEHIAVNNNGDSIEIFTPDELTKLLAHASRQFLPMLVLGAFAGIRAAEIDRLTFEDLFRVEGFVEIAGDTAKTSSRRLVPMLPNLAQWLAPYANDKGKIWTGTENDLKDARAETVKAAQVAWKDNGLRHSFISYRLADIQDADQVGLEAGNCPKMIFKHYRKLVTPEQATVWFAIVPEMPANVVNMKEAAK